MLPRRIERGPDDRRRRFERDDSRAIRADGFRDRRLRPEADRSGDGEERGALPVRGDRDLRGEGQVPEIPPRDLRERRAGAAHGVEARQEDRRDLSRRSPAFDDARRVLGSRGALVPGAARVADAALPIEDGLLRRERRAEGTQRGAWSRRATRSDRPDLRASGNRPGGRRRRMRPEAGAPKLRLPSGRRGCSRRRIRALAASRDEREPAAVRRPRRQPRAARVGRAVREVAALARAAVDQPHVARLLVGTCRASVGASRPRDRRRDPLAVGRERDVVELGEREEIFDRHRPRRRLRAQPRSGDPNREPEPNQADHGSLEGPSYADPFLPSEAPLVPLRTTHSSARSSESSSPARSSWRRVRGRTTSTRGSRAR